MKKQIFFSFFIFCIGSILAQCPLGVSTHNGVTGTSESMQGQTINNTCAFSLTGVTISLQNATTGTLTMRIKTVGAPVCSGSTLTNGTATLGASTSGDKNFTFSPAVSLAANTNYFIEITGAIIDVSNVRSRAANAYAAGIYYYSNVSDGSCQLDNGFDLRFTLIGAVVLPVELVQFNAQNTEGSKNYLTWQTASESQNKGFEIERSTDGVRFDKIGFVAGNGTTNTRKEYSFEDKSPTGITYYRLKQLDFDGRFKYSKIIAIDRKGENVVSVFPNPSNGIFTITGIEDTEEETFILINSIGQTLSINVQNDGQLDMSAYPSGVYYLRVASSGQVMKLVKE